MIFNMLEWHNEGLSLRNSLNPSECVQPSVSQSRKSVMQPSKECLPDRMVRRDTVRCRVPGWEDSQAKKDKSKAVNRLQQHIGVGLSRDQGVSNLSGLNASLRRSVETEQPRVIFKNSVLQEARPALGRSVLKSRPSVARNGSVFAHNSRGSTWAMQLSKQLA